MRSDSEFVALPAAVRQEMAEAVIEKHRATMHKALDDALDLLGKAAYYADRSESPDEIKVLVGEKLLELPIAEILTDIAELGIMPDEKLMMSVGSLMAMA
jgi:hypothetical protein